MLLNVNEVWWLKMNLNIIMFNSYSLNCPPFFTFLIKIWHKNYSLKFYLPKILCANNMYIVQIILYAIDWVPNLYINGNNIVNS